MTSAAVAVTGLGAVTPIGRNVASTWEALLAGASGVRRIAASWADLLPVKIAAQVIDELGLDRVEARTLDRSAQFALLAAREAWADAGLHRGADNSVEPERLAVVVGSGIGGAITLLEQDDILEQKGARRVSPHTVPMLMPNGPAATIGLDLRARAGVHTPVSACASGGEAIALGLDLIRAGRADVVVVGGTEAPIHPLPIAGFAQMRALSTRNDDPEHACRPYDKARDGFVLGEGAGVLVLERLDSAAARGARVHALLLGAGITSDAHHVTAPEPNGTGAARAITLALADCGLSAHDVRHVNAHATSTTVGDVAEATAIRRALGGAADAVPVSATKSQTGHLIGAAGAVEAILTILALRDRLAPATHNLDNPDDGVDLDVVRLEHRVLAAGGAGLSNSFGFGGHNVCLVFAQ